ncbi:MAG: peptidase dimerization domain-containing protein, partial [Saprospiraceae bacterium]|nr:peptidase dimerization domain-containing protein [Saprospiraceae bacterium]
HPPLEVGKVGFHAGEYMASADEIYLEIIGKGGHAALPSNFIDTILVASQVVSALHTVVSRFSDPKVPTVLSFGKIFSDGGATNIIPEKVHILGTLRTMDEANRVKLHKVIKKLVQNTVKSYGAKAKVNIKYGYPTLYNDIGLTESSISHAQDFLGSKNVVMLEKRMTAEDFSYFSQMMPACFYRLGTGNKAKNITSPVHTSTFNIDERAIKVGTGLMAYLALKNSQ